MKETVYSSDWVQVYRWGDKQGSLAVEVGGWEILDQTEFEKQGNEADQLAEMAQGLEDLADQVRAAARAIDKLRRETTL